MSETFCILPWIHLATHPNGGASLCCRSNHTNAVSWAKKATSQELLKLDDSNIKEIVNSSTFVRVRRAMLNGERPVECEGCWKDEALGLESKRQYENKRWSKVIPILQKEEIIDDVNFRYVELRLGNVCNNACVTCNSFSSTKWYRDEQKLSQDLSWFKLRPLENFKWFENPDFYKDLLESSKDLKEIYINGGEPTLIKEHYKFLESLIDLGRASDIHLVYSLNLMDIPDSLIDIWKHFKKVTINASIDDMEERNFYIRYPTKWDQVLTSINKLSLQTNLEWTVTQTVSMLNVRNLDKLSSWLRSNYNKEPYHNYVLYPDYLSLAVLPKDYKEKVIQELTGKLPAHQETELFSKLTVEYSKELHQKAKEFLLALDKARGLDCKSYIKELEEIL